ncbi:MAG: hypothetical protein COA32_00885 [Fluviicola sp.]|nr:MAG: hypothetical protein COA32_00885 [Fluviicola sp.]
MLIKKLQITYFLVLMLTILAPQFLLGQRQSGINKYFSNVEVSVDTNTYNLNSDVYVENGERKLAFEYREDNPVAVFRFYPNPNDIKDRSYALKKSNEYEIVDSLVLLIDGYYQCKVQFIDLSQSEFLNIFLLTEGKHLPIPLFPYTYTYATIYPGDGDFFIGEEKVIPVVSNNDANIAVNPKWIKKDNYEYRLYRKKGELSLSILPTVSGELEFELPIRLNRPNIENGKATYKLEPQKFTFNVKGSRLSFLQFDKREVVWKRDQKEGYELQLDNHAGLQINKTYRVEATDEKGGPLIAELYTVRRLSNDKVLCMFRPYNFHKIAEGYLFIKDGDTPRYITNIDIAHEPKIKSISILREGGNWINSNQIYPGETVEIRLEGESLSRADFNFEDLQDISTDSIVQNEVVSHYLLRVPVDIRKKAVNIYNKDKKTGRTLDIIEYQRPRELDFVILEFGGKPVIASSVTEPILHRGTIGDVLVQFDDFFIDERYELYGKQFLEIEVRIKDRSNALIEKQVIDDIVICPGSSSPRSFSYTSPDGCMNEAISINDYVSNKTHGLENWGTIELIIKHRKNMYGGKGYTERIEIIKEKRVTFDVDLSIPAGLIIKKVGVDGFPGLSGISLSMLAQFSFYQKGEIQRLRPYKIGAGFLAKNAFNFNPDAERDLGIVILGSVYPTRKERKFSFPLYAGMGYFLNEDKFFYLIGPGIRINF